MSSPAGLPPVDLSGYVDLRPFDLSDQEVIAGALAQLALNVPELELREGHMEVVLLESIALEIAELIVAANRIPGAVAEAIIQLAGVTRDVGAEPTATATVVAGDTVGHTIPAGTRVWLPLPSGDAVTFLIETDSNGDEPSIPAGETTVEVSLIGAEYTAAANGSPPGTTLELADPVPWIDTITLATAATGGRGVETDDAWRDRGVTRLSRLSDALVVPAHFEAAALEDSAVGRALVIDVWDPTSGDDPGENPGHITVCVLGADGLVLSAPAKAALETSMEDRAVATLDVHVVDALIDDVDVAVTVTLFAGYEPDLVEDAVTSALDAYLNPLTWQAGDTVRLNELIALVDRVEGVDHVLTVLINGVASDLVMTSARSLPDADALTVTIS